MASWNTKIKFCKIPEWVISNGSQIEFENLQEQLDFFKSHVVEDLDFDNMSYMRINGGSAKVKINKDALDAKAPNWIMFQNADFGEKWIFANILDTYYISPNVTDVTYATDSFQTFQHDIDRSRVSYISRRTWSGKNDDENQLMQLPFEDLNVGNDFVYCDTVFDFNDSQGDFETEVFYYILITEPITSTGQSHEILTGTHSQSYMVGDEEKTISYSNGQNSVLYGYVLNFKLLNSFLNQGVFQSDCKIVNALQLILQLPFGRSMFREGLTNIASNINISTSITIPEGAELYDQKDFGYMAHEEDISGWSKNLCDYINKSIANDYNKEYDPSVPTSAIGKYLFRYPYSLLESYDFYNQPLTLRIEQLNRVNQFEYIRSQVLPTFKYASIGQNPMLVYGVKGAGNTGATEEWNEKNTVDNLYAMTGNDYNIVQASVSLPIISDYLASFLQANMNQINAQRANLRDSLNTQMTNAGSTLQASTNAIELNRQNLIMTAENQAVNARTTAQASYDAQIASNNTQYGAQGTAMSDANENLRLAKLQGGFGEVGGIASAAVGVATGNPLMALGGIGAATLAGLNTTWGAGAHYNQQVNNIQMMYDTNASNANLTKNAALLAANNTRQTALAMAANTAAAAQATANANYANAARSAATNYANEIRSLNARIEDASNIPASIQSMGNNASIFNQMFNRDIIKYSTKSLPRTVMQRLIDYFSFYGFITAMTDTLENIRLKFEDDPGYYVQTVNCNLSGNVPPDHLKAICDMYNAGVHLWKKDHFKDYDGMRGV